MQRRERKKFNELSSEEREQFAEHSKERIYSTITLLAVITAMWHGAAHHTYLGALATIVGSVVALWMATLMADRLSYRAVHGASVPRARVREDFFSASGLLAPAFAPVFFVILSMLGVLSLSKALLVSMIALLFSLFIFSVMGSRQVYDSYGKIFAISLLELCIGLGVVALKLLVGE